MLYIHKHSISFLCVISNKYLINLVIFISCYFSLIAVCLKTHSHLFFLPFLFLEPSRQFYTHLEEVFGISGIVLTSLASLKWLWNKAQHFAHWKIYEEGTLSQFSRILSKFWAVSYDYQRSSEELLAGLLLVAASIQRYLCKSYIQPIL